MPYVIIAIGFLAWLVAALVREVPPQTYRGTLAGILVCATVAATWPLVLCWRGLLGPAPRP